MIFYLLLPLFVYFVRKAGKALPLILLFIAYVVVNVLFDEVREKYGLERFEHFFYQMNMFIFFFGGMGTLLYLDKVVDNMKWLFPLAVAVEVGESYFDVLYYLEPMAFPILLIGVAYSLKFLFFLKKYDNISYGMYLYHYPIIQTMISFGLVEYNIYLAFAATVVITIACAYLSWHYVEKPFITRQTPMAKR